MRLAVRVGDGSDRLMDEMMRGLTCPRLLIAFLSWKGLPVPLNHWSDDLLLTCEQLMRDDLLAEIGDDAKEYL